MAGVFMLFFNYVENNSFNLYIHILSLLPLKPFGPHIYPKSLYLNKPVKIYKPNLDRNIIGIENREKTLIYQWINLINGKIYVGSAWSGSRRLLSYWTPSVLKRNLPIYNSLNYYTHNNFMLVILENLGKTGKVTKKYMLSREQYYLDILFKFFPSLVLNSCPRAGTTLGYKHKPEFIKNRLGSLNPMGKLKDGKQFSPEFIFMQKRNKAGENNPNFGKIKSLETLAKLTKLIYVYNYEDMSIIGSYSTVDCAKTFKMGKDTLSKYIKSGLPFKGKLYSRTKLHN
jgi:group I intron endonuclease